MAHHLHTLKGRPRLLELLLTGVRTSQGMGKFSDSAVKSGVSLLWISGWGICRRQGPIRPPPSEPVQAVPGTPTPPSEVFLTTTPHRSAYKSATHPAQVVALQCVAMLPFLLPLVKALQFFLVIPQLLVHRSKAMDCSSPRPRTRLQQRLLQASVLLLPHL